MALDTTPLTPEGFPIALPSHPHAPRMVQGNGICKSEGTILELKIRFRIPEHATQVRCVCGS